MPLWIQGNRGFEENYLLAFSETGVMAGMACIMYCSIQYGIHAIIGYLLVLK